MLSKLRFLLVCILLLCAKTAVMAQAFVSGSVMSVSGNPQLMATADFNHDGKPDLVYQDAYEGGNLHILLGNGDGTFRIGQVIVLDDAVGSVITVGDINGDGIPDLALGYNGHAAFTSRPYALPSISVLLGNGDGTFQPLISNLAGTLGSPNEMNYHAAIADFDGDGKPDLMYSGGDTDVYFMKGDGAGHLAPPVGMDVNTPFTGDIFTADFNGDGRPDIVVPGNYNFAVMLNQGEAKFSPPVYYKTDLYSTSQKTFALEDINRDGHPDILYIDFSGSLWVAYGKPDGTFAPPVIMSTVPNEGVAIVGISDLHGDQKLRAFISSSEGVSVSGGATPGGVRIYAGTGYLHAQNVLADFNGDGLTDIAIPGDQSIVILYGNLDGTFAAAPSIQVHQNASGFAMIDVTGDHIPDAVLGANSVYPGNGDGTFSTIPLGNGLLSGPANSPIYTGDIDRDGKTDLFYYQSAYFGAGDGSFTQDFLAPLSSVSAFPNQYAVLADFNLDGRSDIASAYSSTISIALSGNSRTFTYSHLNLAESVGPLVSGDLNGDGCPDLVAGGTDQIVILKGDCAGNFSQVGVYPTGFTGIQSGNTNPANNSPTDITLSDLDIDGNLDIIYTIPGQSLARLLYGKGDGTFSPGLDIPLAHSSLFITAGDLDADGRPDLIFTGATILTLLHGQAGRTFSTPTYLAAGAQTGKAVIADLNRDGNPDIAVPNGDVFTVILSPLPPRTSPALNVTLTVAPEPSAFGQTFTATANFIPAANPTTPTGTATFTIDGASPITGALSSNGAATATFASASVGSHTIAVNFPGDANFAPASASVTHVVTGTPTSTTITNCPNATVEVQQDFTLLFTVTSASGTPTGSLSFTDNATPHGAATLVNGSASLLYVPAIAGAHTLTATYIPTGAFAPSSATCTFNVVLNPTKSILTATPTSGALGTPILLTATVTPNPATALGNPTGTVTFLNGATVLGTAPLSSAAIASLTTSALPAGTDNLTCTYSGDSNYASSPCNLVPVAITAAASNITLTSSLNPAPAFTSITFTARLTSNGQPLPAGLPFNLTLNSATIPLTTDANGSATYTTSSLNAGSYLVLATFTPSFAPATNYLGGFASLTQVVTANATSTTLTASPNPAYQNQLVTLTATVASTSTPLGSVNFYDAATLLGSAAVNAAGQATLTTSTLAVGTHPLSATYIASTNFAASTSPTVSEVILPATFTIALQPPAITLAGGAQGSSTIQLGSIGNFSGPLALTFGTLPAYSTATITPSTVNLTAGGTATATFSINTLLKAASSPPQRPGSHAVPTLFAASALLLLPFAITQRKRLARLLALLAFAALFQTLTGCTNAYYLVHSVEPGTYQIPITATDVHHNTQSATLTLTITP